MQTQLVEPTVSGLPFRCILTPLDEGGWIEHHDVEPFACGVQRFEHFEGIALAHIDLHAVAGGVRLQPLDCMQMAKPSTDQFVWSDIWRFNRSYWYLVALCVLFYSVIFPFRSTFAIAYFQHAHGLPLDTAGQMNSYVFLAAVIVTPIFGWVADRFGRRGVLMALGSLLLPLSFLILAETSWSLWVTTALIGISFSLVPAVLWPSVSILVEPRRLGTAFGLMTMLQNIGLTLCNVFVGAINDAAHAGADNPAGYLPMLTFFGVLSSLGFVFAWLLRVRERSPAGHGLERPAASL